MQRQMAYKCDLAIKSLKIFNDINIDFKDHSCYDDKTRKWTELQKNYIKKRKKKQKKRKEKEK